MTAYYIQAPGASASMDPYTRGMQRNIARNRAVGAANKRQAWFAADESRNELVRDIAVAAHKGNQFMANMLEAINQWGALTEKQEAAARASLAKAAERQAERDAEYAAKAATAQHVGTVGERQAFMGKVVRIITGDSQYGPYRIVTLEDMCGNQMVIKGKFPHDAEQGVWVNFKATVASHSEYKGVKQTTLNRVADAILTTQEEMDRCTAEAFRGDNS